MLEKLRRWPRWVWAALLIAVSWLIIFPISVMATQFTDTQRNLLILAGIVLTAVVVFWAAFSKIVVNMFSQKELGQPPLELVSSKGQGYRAETQPTAAVGPDAGDTVIEVRYQAHVQDVGWMGWVQNDQVAGITGQKKRLEAVRIELVNALPGMGVTYQAHVGNIGWLEWVSNGEVAGTTGQARQMEAVRIELTKAPSEYRIAYQAHVKDIGWLDWVYDGQTAGTVGQSRQMEALRIHIATQE
jgi:transglutaminase/protease-like cytokinesis protein 3